MAVAGQLAFAGSASATHTMVLGHNHMVGTIAPNKYNELDCNGWGTKYKSFAPAMRMHCTDPHGKLYAGRVGRFYDNGHYVGHDEPSVKFISSLAGSGNAMTYGMRLPKDPTKAPTANGSVTDYTELSVAPWFGLAMCDGHSYPQNPCKPDSDTNMGQISNPKAAGSAFMEMQFYPPGDTPFIDGDSCSKTAWCAALNIDSLECTFNFASCNTACEEPINFSFIQTNGIPPGPPAPQDPNTGTFLGNAQTLKMNGGDVLKVTMTDPASGFTVRIQDLTTHQTGWIQASAKNGFADTNMADCSGNPFTWHAEYSTAKKQNQTPWAALEGGVLMQQEIGHGEACSAVANKEGFSSSYSDGSSFSDPNVFQNCVGGKEGASAKGEGPCSTTTGVCVGSETEGPAGPVPCTSTTGHCENSDGFCFPKGTRTATVNGKAVQESSRLNFCYQTQFENGDLDYDGTSYSPDWPNGTSNFPQSFEYWGPTTNNGKTYQSVQYETDAPASEQLCNVSTGTGCVVPPIGSTGKFYPFWSITNKLALKGVTVQGRCLWLFGNFIQKVTTRDFGRDKQYGTPDLARFGGTTISKVLPNPVNASSCQPRRHHRR